MRTIVITFDVDHRIQADFAVHSTTQASIDTNLVRLHHPILQNVKTIQFTYRNPTRMCGG
jgi:hypothetical protein